VLAQRRHVNLLRSQAIDYYRKRRGRAVYLVYWATDRVQPKRVFDCFQEEDFVAEYYLVTDLGTLPGGSSSNAYDINDSGQVVGS